MTFINEQQIIDKKYYQILTSAENPLKSLQLLSFKLPSFIQNADKHIDEIRFAQGELYYLLGDYETAVYKWESINTLPLSGWASKNMGDAYYKAGFMEKAEEIYSSISFASSLHKLECLLALYAVYSVQQENKKLGRVVNELVAVDCSYKNITDIALAYYEGNKEFHSAFSLIVSVLEKEFKEELLLKLFNYIKDLDNEIIPPSHAVSRLLKILWSEEKEYMLSMLQSLNDLYKKSPFYLEWLEILYILIEETKHSTGPYLLTKASESFNDLFNQLFSGQYSLSEIKNPLEHHFPLYMEICKEKPISTSFKAALLAWEEMNPGTIPNKVSQNSRESTLYIDRFDEFFHYYLNIKDWMNEIGVKFDELADWWLEYYMDISNKKIIVSGSFSNGKSSFINSILEEEVLIADNLPTTSIVTIIQHSKDKQIHELTASSMEKVEEEIFISKTTIDHGKDEMLKSNLIIRELPSLVLEDSNITLIDTPGFNDQKNANNPTYEYLPLADEVLFVFNSETPFPRTEKDIITKILKEQPDMPINFILNKADYLDEEELDETLEDIERKTYKHLNNEVSIIPYSSIYTETADRKLILEYFNKAPAANIKEQRIKKAIPYFYQLIGKFKYFLSQKEKEINVLIRLKKNEVQSIKHIIEKFDGFKKKVISQSIQQYVNSVVTSTYEFANERTLVNLRSFSHKIDLHSDLKNVHITLDREMNEMLDKNLNKVYLPYVNSRYKRWLLNTNETHSIIKRQIELFKEEIEDVVNDSKTHNISFQTYEFTSVAENKFIDILEKIHYKELDILKKVNPFQNILKGVGNLFGGRSYTATLKIEQYKSFIENKSYEEATREYIFNITKPLGEFENTIRSEFLKIFTPFETYMNTELQRSTEEIRKNAQELKNLYTQKDSYFERIQIYQLKIRQLELINDNSKSNKATN